MSYLSLYRKYRSQTFSDLIGQDHVVRTLQNAVASGKIAHSYLFTGPRGTGKTSSARLLAKCLNCEKGPTPEPCNACEQCLSITAGNCVDVYELDAASESGVENVRETIVEAVQYAPNFCRYKVFIIDEVHDLSNKAFDALLKTIEEPPSYVIFILATTEYNKVPPTIRSRCQKYEFHRASLQNLVDRLTYVITSEGGEADPAALTAIARMADGGYRDALTLLEQALLTSEGRITLQHVYDQLGLVSEETVDGILIAIRHANIPQLVEVLEDVARRGRDPRAVLESMMYRLQDLTRAAYVVEAGVSGDATREASLFGTAAHLGRENLLWLRGAISEAHKAIRDVTLPRIWLEAELIRIASRPQAAHPAAPQPAQTQQQPKPKSQAVVETEPKPVEPPKVEEKPIPADEGPSDKWQRVVGELTTMSKSMGLRLTGTRVGQISGTHLTIEFASNLEHDWMTSVPKRQAGLLDMVRQVFGEEWTVDLVVNKAGHTPMIVEPEAVELPVEGEPLYKLASEILGHNGNSK
ncbi:MAG TPA: DNA polymerase III subunit gamma/tau [Fimbriimonadaceae bacterium]|nr:DNA polymerase III subunit gamma/tau [Fimbriimonadaceae bacterium]